MSAVVEARTSDPGHHSAGPGREGGRRRWPTGYLLLLPLLVLVTAVLIVPVAAIAIQSLQTPDGSWTLSTYREVVGDPVYRKSIVDTFVLGVMVTAICLVLGYVIAYRMMTRWRRFAPLVAGVLLLSFWSGLLIRTFSWMILLGKEGLVAATASSIGIDHLPQLLYNRTGAVIGMVNIMLPYMALTLFASMNRVDQRTMIAAESLGARPTVAFWRVFIPATLPGIAAGSLLVFVITIGFFVTPELLGGPETAMISQRVAKVVQVLLDFRLAGALSLVLVAVTMVMLVIYNRLFSLKDLSRGL